MVSYSRGKRSGSDDAPERTKKTSVFGDMNRFDPCRVQDQSTARVVVRPLDPSLVDTCRAFEGYQRSWWSESISTPGSAILLAEPQAPSLAVLIAPVLRRSALVVFIPIAGSTESE